jgi:hypothetical protein
MRNLLLLTLFALSWAAVAQTATAAPASEAEEIASVKLQEEAFRQAELKYDREAARQILAEEFVIVGNHGENLSRAEFIDLVGDKADPLEVLEYGDLQVRIYGQTALVRSTIHERAVYGGKRDEYRGLRTAMWVKRDGRWQCVLMQTSASEEKKS